MTRERRRAVVTGLGIASAAGCHVEAAWRSLLAGHSSVSRIRRIDAAAYPSQIAAEVDETALTWSARWRDRGRIARYAAHAGGAALEASGLTSNGADRRRIGVIVAAGIWFLTARGRRSDEVAVQSDSLSNVEVEGDLKSTKKGSGGGSRVVGKSGGFPILGGGQSCESARNAYVEEMTMGGPKGQADLTAGQYGSVLNRGSYFAHCGVPDSTHLKICAAVQNGRAVGVTVTASPPDRRIQSCVAAGVRGLSFPSNPKLDVSTTTF